MDKRSYPKRPLLAVSAVITNENKLLLIKRAKEPSLGNWHLPGGVVELGETLKQAILREVFEELGLIIEVQKQIDVIDIIEKDTKGDIKYHFVIIVFVANLIKGEVKLSPEILEYKWVDKTIISELKIDEKTKKLLINFLS